jgi:biotin carboxylase
VARLLLIVPSATYRAPDFLAAARALGVDVVIGSEVRQTLSEPMGDRAVELDLCAPDRAIAQIEALHGRRPLDAIVAVDDGGAVVAAGASARLELPHNPVDAVARTRDKLAMRRAFAAASIPQPAFAPDRPVGFPCVVKPVGLAASRGVIRADDADQLAAAIARVTPIASGSGRDGELLVEEYVPGAEVAIEGLLVGGVLTVLAVFDKPDPLVGPYFEETIYVTPSRLEPGTLDRVGRLAGSAAAALGLREGPVHAELRLDGDRIVVLEVAARSIGGLCARTLRFGAGIALEEVILRHALGLALDDLAREPDAAGVMMLPIPRAGTLRAVRGQDAARAIAGIVGVELTIHPGRPVVPLPEGDRYLGFLFARAATPEAVEASLRAAADTLDIVVT